MFFLKRKISAGTYIITIVTGIVIFLFSLWAVVDSTSGKNSTGFIGQYLLKVARLPGHALKEEIKPRVTDSNRYTQTEKFWANPQYPDSGFLLISSYDKAYKQTVIKLLSLRDGKIIHTWIPNLDSLRNMDRPGEMPYFNITYLSSEKYKALHPLLMADTSVIIKSDDGLCKLDKNSKIVWYKPGVFHHPTEVDSDGNLWIATVKKSGKFSQDMYPGLKEDAIAKLDTTGNILYEKSIAEILLENGFEYLIFGVGSYEADPIHVNDIQPVLRDGQYWHKGDLFINMRNRSTLILYRPSTNKIVWIKTGPWMNEHDPSIVDETRIAVFSNNIVRGDNNTLKLIHGYNDIYIYDFKTDRIIRPYTALLKEQNISTLSEGRALILPDGDVVVEASNCGRVLRGNNNILKWSYVEIVDKKTVGVVQWCRYYTTISN